MSLDLSAGLATVGAVEVTTQSYVSFAGALDRGLTAQDQNKRLQSATSEMQHLHQQAMAGHSPQERLEAINRMTELQKQLKADGVIDKNTDMSAFGIGQAQFDKTKVQAGADYLNSVRQKMELGIVSDPTELHKVAQMLKTVNGGEHAQTAQTLASDLDKASKYKVDPSVGTRGFQMTQTSQFSSSSPS